MEIHNKKRSYIPALAAILPTIGLCGLFWLAKTSIVPRGSNDMSWIHGKVIDAYAFNTDFVIHMENDSGRASYYINRYLDDGKSLDSIKRLILHKDVRIKYYANPSILDPKDRSRPIDTLYCDSIIMY